MPKGKKEGERAKDNRPPATAALESARRRLEAATFERYNSFDGGMAHFRENVATLVPLKFYLGRVFKHSLFVSHHISAQMRG